MLPKNIFSCLHNVTWNGKDKGIPDANEYGFGVPYTSVNFIRLPLLLGNVPKNVKPLLPKT